jgi:hypothetical protein
MRAPMRLVAPVSFVLSFRLAMEFLAAWQEAINPCRLERREPRGLPEQG